MDGVKGQGGGGEGVHEGREGADGCQQSVALSHEGSG